MPATFLAAVNAFVWPDFSNAGGTVARPPVISLFSRIRAVSVVGLWGFAVYSMYTYLGTGLSMDAKMSTGLVALALVVYGVGAVAGSLVGGRLADRYGAARVATTSLVLVAAMLVVLDLAVLAPTPLLLITLLLFALCAYPCLPSYQAGLVATFPANSGSLLAWNSSSMYLGTSLGSAVGGLLLSTLGFRAIPVVAAFVAVLGALSCAYWAITVSPHKTDTAFARRGKGIEG